MSASLVLFGRAIIYLGSLFFIFLSVFFLYITFMSFSNTFLRRTSMTDIFKIVKRVAQA